MRKFVLSAFAVALTTALALAGEVTFLAFDKAKGELKVKDGAEVKTYKITAKTVFKSGDMTIKKQENGPTRLEKMKPEKGKFTLTADKDEVTEIKFAAPKKDK